MTGKPVEGLRVRKYNAKEARTGYLLVLPAILGFLFFCVMPILYSAVLSFTDWNVLKPAKFIGLKNYIKLLTGDRQFASAIQATFSYAISSTIFSSLYAFLLALLLNNEIRGKSVFRTIFYLPSIVPAVANALLRPC